MRTTLASCAVCVLLVAALGAALAAEPEGAKDQGKTSARRSPAAAAKHDPRTVAVHVFNKDGKLVGPVESPKVVLSAGPVAAPADGRAIPNAASQGHGRRLLWRPVGQ